MSSSPLPRGPQPPLPSGPTPPEVARAAKPLPKRELLMGVMQPGVDHLVAILARTRIEPHHVVLGHTLIGLAAAWLLAGGSWFAWLGAALLLQLKSLLDNVDGGLARATGRVTRMGRYLDTLMDLVVNTALFLALAQHGPAWLSLAAFVTLTWVLSLEFNSMRRHLEESGVARTSAVPASVPPGAPPGVLAWLEGAYALLLAPQDRLLRRLDERLFAEAAGMEWSQASDAERRRWADSYSVAMLVNLGLSTQLLLLGTCAAVGLPYAYVMLVILQIPYVLLVQASRVRRYRAARPA